MITGDVNDYTWRGEVVPRPGPTAKAAVIQSRHSFASQIRVAAYTAVVMLDGPVQPWRRLMTCILLALLSAPVPMADKDDMSVVIKLEVAKDLSDKRSAIRATIENRGDKPVWLIRLRTRTAITNPG